MPRQRILHLTRVSSGRYSFFSNPSQPEITRSPLSIRKFGKSTLSFGEMVKKSPLSLRERVRVRVL
jgi:hypothetical protein